MVDKFASKEPATDAIEEDLGGAEVGAVLLLADFLVVAVVARLIRRIGVMNVVIAVTMPEIVLDVKEEALEVEKASGKKF